MIASIVAFAVVATSAAYGLPCGGLIAPGCGGIVAPPIAPCAEVVTEVVTVPSIGNPFLGGCASPFLGVPHLGPGFLGAAPFFGSGFIGGGIYPPMMGGYGMLPSPFLGGGFIPPIGGLGCHSMCVC